MKSFIYKLLAFVALVIVLSCALDYAITTGLRRYFNWDTEVMIDLRDKDITPDFIVLGSCQAPCDYAPNIFDSVLHVNSYVFGAFNMTLPAHMSLWEEYKGYHTELPRYVLITLDYSDLHFARLKKSVVEEQFIPLAYDKPIRDFMLSDGGYSVWDIYMPCVRYFGYHKSIQHGIEGFMEVKHGYRLRYKGHDFVPIGYQFARADVPDDNYIAVEPELIDRLSAWIEELQESGVKPILVTAPLGYELAEKIVNADDAYRVYDSLANQYHIPYLQYQNHPICHDTAMFNTPAHLNFVGAEVFSKMVADTLLTIQY